jgi:hypothetical protein
VAKLSSECKTRMTTWTVLALLVVGLFILAGYMLFESPGHGTAQPRGGMPAATDR